MFKYDQDAQGIGTITIDLPDSKFNILSEKHFAEVEALLEKVADPAAGVKGLIIISGKKDNFIVGADIKDFMAYDAESGAAASRHGQQILGRLRKLPIPSVAAINGTCMGGGTEMSLNCTARILTDHPKSSISLPEINLGLLPGASGTTLLPRLIGLQASLDMMLTGKRIFPYKARKLGLVDEVVSPGMLHAVAKKMVISLADTKSARRKVRRPLVTRLLDGPLKFVVYSAVTRRIMAQTKGNYPAPLSIIQTVRKSLGKKIDKALAIEAREFGKLLTTPEHKSLAHMFFVSSSKPKLEAEPTNVDQVSVIGGGLMGSGIATVALDNGLTVRHNDLNLDVLGRAHGHIQAYFDIKAQKRIITGRDADLIMNRYSGTTNLSGFDRSQIIVEAVFEDLDLKRKIIADLEERVSTDTVIATNTSSLPITEVAKGAKYPERIIGMHFFSPVEKMPLIEVIPGESTSAETIATTVAFGQRLGKRVMLVKDSPGFFVNRILTPYLNETFKLLEDGIAIDVLDKCAKRIGFPVGPCALIDEVGLDVAAKVSDVMAAAIGERLEMTDHNARFLADKRLGRKNGRGLYCYTDGKRGAVDESVYRLLDNPARTPIPYDEVRDRLILAILNEAALASKEGLIESKEAGDMGAVFGFGYPPFLGGPFWTMDQIGTERLKTKMTGLAQRYGSRFAPVF